MWPWFPGPRRLVSQVSCRSSGRASTRESGTASARVFASGSATASGRGFPGVFGSVSGEAFPGVPGTVLRSVSAGVSGNVSGVASPTAFGKASSRGFPTVPGRVPTRGFTKVFANMLGRVPGGAGKGRLRTLESGESECEAVGWATGVCLQLLPAEGVEEQRVEVVGDETEDEPQVLFVRLARLQPRDRRMQHRHEPRPRLGLER